MRQTPKQEFDTTRTQTLSVCQWSGCGEEGTEKIDNHDGGWLAVCRRHYWAAWGCKAVAAGVILLAVGALALGYVYLLMQLA